MLESSPLMGGFPLSFWMWVIGWVVASGVVFLALSINGKTEQAEASHDDHGHSHH